MVNFFRLKKLIREYEYKREEEKRDFFERLYNISKEEIKLKQINLLNY